MALAIARDLPALLALRLRPLDAVGVGNRRHIFVLPTVVLGIKGAWRPR